MRPHPRRPPCVLAALADGTARLGGTLDQHPAQRRTPLLFTTLRTLAATSEDIDLRGFEPAFVLIDSDVLAFLGRTVEAGERTRWTVVGSAGDRTVYVLAFALERVPGIIYVMACTSPTGRLVATWMRQRPGTLDHDTAVFQPYRGHLWALVRHLLGAFWMMDLHGWAAGI